MRFRTEIEKNLPDFKIHSNDKILTIGSCFSEIIGNKFVENKLNCLSNPFGVIFNPVSIFKLLSQSINKQPVFNHLYLENEGVWNHYDFHSKLWENDKDSLEIKLNATYKKVERALKECQILMITFGTAYVYKLKTNKQVVANCHKQPSENFVRELISIKEIMIRFRQFYDTFKMFNPRAKIILTVSPVRHTKDTLRLNSVSKSILRTACHLIEEEYKNIDYFPSYEIMLDDLRDYRFYKEDLIHPNAMAEEYIYSKFSESYFSDEMQDFITEWSKIKTALSHRPIKQNSSSHQLFLKKLLEKLQTLPTKMDVSDEIKDVQSQLDKLF